MLCAVCSAEKWSTDAATGKLRKQAAALKVLPCETEQQRALWDREACNIRAMGWKEGGCQVAVPYAPVLHNVFEDVQSRQGIIAMRSAMNTVWGHLFVPLSQPARHIVSHIPPAMNNFVCEQRHYTSSFLQPRTDGERYSLHA